MFIHWGCKDSPETPQTLEICEGKVYQRNKILIKESYKQRKHVYIKYIYIHVYV